LGAYIVLVECFSNLNKEVKMPYLITTSLYPPHKANEVAEKYLEAIQKYPPDENLGINLIPAAVKSTEKGIRVMGVVEVKEGKLEEAISRNSNFMQSFMSIQGYTYRTDTNYTINEALGILGISPSE
jgi:hypothetical protein